MLDEDGRTEEKLAGSDGHAEHDDARSDHAKPLQAFWVGRRRKIGGGPGRETRAGFNRLRMRHRSEPAHPAASRLRRSAGQGERLTDNRTDRPPLQRPKSLNSRRGAWPPPRLRPSSPSAFARRRPAPRAAPLRRRGRFSLIVTRPDFAARTSRQRRASSPCPSRCAAGRRGSEGRAAPCTARAGCAPTAAARRA